ncbi:EF-hand calcium-binding domain-containing protein 12-like isoform X4 [Anas platyrhynchos]|uniref:EF-hand calcium-binding domain-containing protein 12-like isoform X4 n=1 Tax=Anas platyrhynchos TaxID=8839 RepID=UPI003AF2133D
MTNLEALITNIERCSEVEGCTKVTFPTLKKLSVNDVITIWGGVSKQVRQLLMMTKPRAVTVTGLGTFHIKKWLSFENGQVFTFRRPVFSPSKTLGQIRNLKHRCVRVPDDMKIVVLSYENMRLNVPYSKEIVQSCLEETLQYFYRILTNREDTDFTLKDFGTLAIRGQRVKMTFSEGFLHSLNKSTYVVEKLIAKKLVRLDKETALFPSHFGRAHLFPQFEIKAVPRLARERLAEEEILNAQASLLHTLKLAQRRLSPSTLATAEAKEEAEEETKAKESPGRLFPVCPDTEGRQHKETPRKRLKLPLLASEDHRHTGQQRQEEEDSLSSPEITCDTKDDLQKLEAWIQERKQLRSQLKSFGDVEKWLSHKPTFTKLEERVRKRITAARVDQRARSKSVETDRPDCSPPPRSQTRKKGSLPLICAPYPQALIALHNLLHQQKLTMVDIFRKAGMEQRKIMRADFIKVIKETKVPISDKELEDVVIFLTSSKRRNYISSEDLIECQKQWQEMRKGQPKETGEDTQPWVWRNACKAATSPPSAGDKAVGMKPCSPTEPKEKLILLEVPPVNTEPDRRHLDWDEMEEIGKRSRESRRLEKIKDSPIEWKEKCRLVRSGDAPVDEHCLPSTIEGDMGALVDHYRRNAVVNYLNCSKQCKERNICLTDKALQRGLLHPGDKIIKEGEDVRKIRQPGGYYSTGHADATSPLSMSRSKSASGKQAKEAENRRLEKNKNQKSSDNNFWPGHLLDKMRLYFPDKEPDRAHALFSYVHPTRPAYRGI